jgi:hypothetical protein
MIEPQRKDAPVALNKLLALFLLVGTFVGFFRWTLPDELQAKTYDLSAQIEVREWALLRNLRVNN